MWEQIKENLVFFDIWKFFWLYVQGLLPSWSFKFNVWGFLVETCDLQKSLLVGVTWAFGCNEHGREAFIMRKFQMKNWGHHPNYMHLWIRRWIRSRRIIHLPSQNISHFATLFLVPNSWNIFKSMNLELEMFIEKLQMLTFTSVLNEQNVSWLKL
jgi:hypothetical protein